MLKSCSYCGRMHPEGFECPHKPKRIRKESDTKQAQFRATRRWRRKAKQILERDKYLCQACLLQMPGTLKKYNSERLSVHHIIPLSVDFSRKLDDNNLITLCSHHHKLADDGKISPDVLFRIII